MNKLFNKYILLTKIIFFFNLEYNYILLSGNLIFKCDFSTFYF